MFNVTAGCHASAFCSCPSKSWIRSKPWATAASVVKLLVKSSWVIIKSFHMSRLTTASIPGEEKAASKQVQCNTCNIFSGFCWPTILAAVPCTMIFKNVHETKHCQGSCPENILCKHFWQRCNEFVSIRKLLTGLTSPHLPTFEESAFSSSCDFASSNVMEMEPWAMFTLQFFLEVNSPCWFPCRAWFLSCTSRNLRAIFFSLRWHRPHISTTPKTTICSCHRPKRKRGYFLDCCFWWMRWILMLGKARMEMYCTVTCVLALWGDNLRFSCRFDTWSASNCPSVSKRWKIQGEKCCDVVGTWIATCLYCNVFEANPKSSSNRASTQRPCLRRKPLQIKDRWFLQIRANQVAKSKGKGSWNAISLSPRRLGVPSCHWELVSGSCWTKPVALINRLGPWSDLQNKLSWSLDKTGGSFDVLVDFCWITNYVQETYSRFHEVWWCWHLNWTLIYGFYKCRDSLSLLIWILLDSWLIMVDYGWLWLVPKARNGRKFEYSRSKYGFNGINMC